MPQQETLNDRVIREGTARIQELSATVGRALLVGEDVFAFDPEMEPKLRRLIESAETRIPRYLSDIERYISLLPEPSQIMLRARLQSEIKETLFCYWMMLSELVLDSIPKRPNSEQR